jgi:hypothetical protein
MAPQWSTTEPVELSAESLQALIANDIPAIRIPNFASSQECEAFSTAVRNSPDIHDYSTAPASYLGVVLYEYRQGEGKKEQFFRDVPPAVSAQQSLYEQSIDVPKRFFGLLGQHWDGDIAVAHEPGLGDYCPVVVRIASKGVHLHFDFAPYNSPGWEIGKITAQITWNLYTETPVSGGETTVYNAPWEPKGGEDPAKGFADPAVESDPDVQSITFAANTGEVVMVNPRNPHRIAAGSGEPRISIGSFLGLAEGNKLLMWA